MLNLGNFTARFLLFFIFLVYFLSLYDIGRNFRTPLGASKRQRCSQNCNFFKRQRDSFVLENFVLLTSFCCLWVFLISHLKLFLSFILSQFRQKKINFIHWTSCTEGVITNVKFIGAKVILLNTILVLFEFKVFKNKIQF